MTWLRLVWVVAAGLTVARGARAQGLDAEALTCGTVATYFPSDMLWAVEPNAATPGDPLPIYFRVQQDGSSEIAGNDEGYAVDRAFATWMNTTCGNASTYPNLLMLDGYDALGGDYPTRDRGDVGSSFQNIVYWIDPPATWIADANTSAVTTLLASSVTGMIFTADLEFNGVDFDWRVVDGTTKLGCASGERCFDVERVALHEAGHFIGLRHVMCTDAIMFAQAAPTDEKHTLSKHELAAICAVYAPRQTTASVRAFAEVCTAQNQCPGGHLCIKDPAASSTVPGWCSIPCVDDDDCPTAFVCATLEGQATTKYCAPGPHGTGSTTTSTGGGGGWIDPETGRSTDYCLPCTSGSQCSNGVCVGDGSGDTLCSSGCGGGADCPQGFSCVATTTSVGVCWPDNPASCGGEDSRGQLNDLCYLAETETTAEWGGPCAPDLVCFGFQPACGTLTGACVAYCNATDKPYGGSQCPDPNQTCCFGTDATGSCVGPSASSLHGGCFSIRRVGESCTTAENSICEPGAACFFMKSPSLGTCYRSCAGDEQCQSDERCTGFENLCGDTVGVCCAKGEEGCVPSSSTLLRDLGVRCTDDDQCNSSTCLRFDGEAACSRQCNAVTGSGCPSGLGDFNGDGRLDGELTCRAMTGEGWCWPVDGPVAPYGTGGGGDESCESCASSESPSVFVAMALLAVGWRMRRRRRA